MITNLGWWLGRLSIGAMALACAGPALAHLEWLSPLGGFVACVSGAALGLLCLGMAALAWVVSATGAASVAPAPLQTLLTVAAAIPGLVLFGVAFAARTAPRINDVATDLREPPALGLESEPSLPDRFRPIIQAAYPDLRPAIAPGTPEAVLERAQALALGMGWEVRKVDRQAGVLHATTITGLFRFRDDVGLRVRAETGGTRVDMRSRSRVGQGDFGANAARIRAFLAALSASER